MLENIVKGKIANALTSAAKDHVVATTDDIYDIRLGMYQEDINALINDLNNRITELEGAVDSVSGEVSSIKTELQEMQNTIQTLIETKQDVIPDLVEIRSGAHAGSTAVQPSTLNNYYTKQETNTLIENKQDKLVAGDNIIISGTTISAEYTEPEVTVPEVLEVLTEDDD